MTVDQLPMVFVNDGTEWSAMLAAQRYIAEHGWSVGPTDITGRRGVLFRPDVTIAKWRNLTDAERAACDAVLIAARGANRDGDVVLYPDRDPWDPE